MLRTGTADYTSLFLKSQKFLDYVGDCQPALSQETYML
jgi:hypothetical protein